MGQLERQETLIPDLEAMLAQEVSGVPATVPADVTVDATVPDVAAEGGPGATGVETADGSERIPFLDLFAGAGGLSIGPHAAGFEPVGAVEIMEDAANASNEPSVVAAVLTQVIASPVVGFSILVPTFAIARDPSRRASA